MNFLRCFDQSGLVGYHPETRRDVVFLWKPVAGVNIPSPLTGPELLAAWGAAELVGSIRSRSVMFFDETDPGTFVQDHLGANVWGRLQYWAGGSTALFPNTGALTYIELSCILTSAAGQPVTLESIDGLTWDWDASTDAPQISRPNCTWEVAYLGQSVVASRWLALSLAPPAGFPAGALCCPWKAADLPSLPIQVSYFTPKQAAGYLELLGAHNAAFYQAESTDAVAGLIALDPRDRTRLTPLRNELCGSRIEFAAGTTLISNYVDSRGLGIRMRSGTGLATPGVARMMARARRATVTASQKWEVTTSREVFRPEGSFEIAAFPGHAEEAEADAAPIEMLAGASGTEFVPVKPGNILTFQHRAGTKNHETLAAPANCTMEGNLLHDGGHHSLKAPWIQFGVPADTPFVSEPAEAAQYQRPASGEGEAEAAGLVRAKLPYAPLNGKALPVMPWAGASGTTGDLFMVDNKEFESTHLASLRRQLLAPTLPPPGPEGGAEQALLDPTYGVTTQGLIAQVRGTEVTSLYFGDPQAEDLKAEFMVSFTPGTTPAQRDAYRDLQQALRAENLFLVVRQTQGVIEVSGSVNLRDFTLRLQLSADVQVALPGILIIKYFKDKSLSELVPDVKVWACKKHFASSLTPAELTTKLQVDGVIPPTLKSAWDKRDWQGVIVLDLATDRMPDLFESLRAGMTESGPAVHHFGLNYLPVKSSELPGAAGAAPVRRGSAFALVHYQGGAAPLGQVADDHEPGETMQAARNYSFKVKTLKLEIQNSQITSFNALLEVGFSHLFWNPTSASSGQLQTLALIGAHESRPKLDGKGTQDIFTLYTRDEIPVPLHDSVMKQFIIRRAELTVRQINRCGTSNRLQHLESFIGLSGELQFDNAKVGDLFDVKSITLERVGLRIDYRPKLENAPGTPGDGCPSQLRECKIGFETAGITADIDFSGARKSFLSIFPVKLKGFRIAFNELLDLGKLKFLKLQGGDTCQFGFDLEIDLGFLGALSGVGKGLKVPGLLGWSKGNNFCFGIQFPSRRGPIDIGIQSFVSLRAENATLISCGAGNQKKGMAIVLSNAQLVFFGEAWPAGTKCSCALFVPAGGERKVSWAFGVPRDEPPLKYLGVGHRIRPLKGHGAKGLLKDFQSLFSADPGADPCSMVGSNKVDPAQNGWVVVTEFDFEEMVKGWLVLADNPRLYALRLEFAAIPAISGELGYRRVSDDLGIFSAEVSLLSSLPPMQFGAASVRLPSLRVEVHSNGGFRVDLGFPWNQDFRNSFQVEVGIFLGSGGFYFGMSTAEALEVLQLTAPEFGFNPPKSEVLREYRALEAGIAFRVGIGRSLDLGLLRGEASLSVFGGLMGAIAFRGDSWEPQVFAVEGYVGIMVHIWAEVDFLILKARAELMVYVKVGFVFRRVLAQDAAGTHHYLTLPVVLYAEVGLYVSFELKVKIGCVWVTLCTLEFRATWHLEETIGGFSSSRIDGGGGADIMLEDSPAPFLQWNDKFWDAVPPVPLTVYAGMLACAAHGRDLDLPEGPYYPCVIAQLMLDVPAQLVAVAQFLTAWALELPAGDDTEIRRDLVMQRRQSLKSDTFWSGAAATLVWETLAARFTITLAGTPIVSPEPFAAIPLWPGVTWSFSSGDGGGGDGGESRGQVPKARMISVPSKAAGEGAMEEEAGKAAMVDYLRCLTDATLAEFDRILRQKFPALLPKDAFLSWGALWAELKDATNTTSLMQRIAQEINRSYLHGSRARVAGESRGRPLTVLNGQQGHGLPAQIAAGIVYHYNLGGSSFSRTPDAAHVDKINAAATEALTAQGAELKRLFNLESEPPPTWVCHQKAYSFASPPLPKEMTTLSGPGEALVRMRRLPAPMLREISAGFSAGETGVEISLCQVVDEKDANSQAVRQALKPLSHWQTGVMARCPVTKVTGEPLLELVGIPQHERWYIDQLGLLDDTPRSLPPGTRVKVVLEWSPTPASPPASLVINDWLLARKNLTGLARPGTGASGESEESGLILPYAADETQLDDTVRLFQMASITNTRGYYLRARDLPGTLPEGAELVLCVVLPEAPGAGADAQVASRAVNAMYLGAAVTNEEVVRFHGLHHVEVSSHAPPGCLSFGWKRVLPELPPGTEDGPHTKEGYAADVHLVDYLVRDRTKAITTYTQKLQARGVPDDWHTIESSDDFGPALSPLKPLQGQILTAGPGSRRTVLSLSSEMAGAQPEAQEKGTVHYRTTLRFAYENVYQRLADEGLRELSITSGFRDIFGNRIFPGHVSQEQSLEYRDMLLKPSEWSGIRLQLLPAGSGRVTLQLGVGELAGDPAELRRRHSLIRDQLRGAGDDDVRVSMVNEDGDHFTFTPERDLLGELREFWNKLLTGGAAPTLEMPFKVQRGAAATTRPTPFLPKLQIERTKHLPAEVLPENLGTGEIPQAMIEGIRVVSSPVLLACKSLFELDVQDPQGKPKAREEFTEIAREFERLLGTGWSSRAAIWRDRFNEHQVWFLPEVLLPQKAPAKRRYATPRPLSTTLGQGTYLIPDLIEQVPPADATQAWHDFGLNRLRFDDIDYDVTARKIFSWLETLLSPGRITNDRRMSDGGRLADILLERKHTLAETLGSAEEGSWIAPVFSGQATQPAGLKRMAQDAFKRNLGQFYGMDTFVQHEVALSASLVQASGISNYHGIIDAKFLHQAAPSPDTPPARTPKFSDFVLSAADDLVPGENMAVLTVLYDLAPGEENHWDLWKTQEMKATVTHLQLSDGTPRHQFDKGQWLELVTPHQLELVSAADDLKVPAITRSYPPKPVPKTCDMVVKEPDKAVAISDLPRWSWVLDFSAADTTNDRLHLRVDYNQEEAAAAHGQGAEAEAGWKTLDLLHDLLVLQPLAAQPDEWWDQAAAQKVWLVLPELLSFLIGHLGPDVSLEGAMPAPMTDSFVLNPTKPGRVPNPENPVIQEVELSRLPGSGLLADFHLTTTAPDRGWASLFGPKAAINFQPSLRLRRNDNLGGDSTVAVNQKLVYECGPVAWGDIFQATIRRPLPSQIPASAESLEQRIQTALENILGHAGPYPSLAFNFGVKYGFSTKYYQVPTPDKEFPVDEVLGDSRAMAAAIAAACGKFLNGAVLADYPAGRRPHFAIRMKVSRASDGATGGRSLLECILVSELS